MRLLALPNEAPSKRQRADRTRHLQRAPEPSELPVRSLGARFDLEPAVGRPDRGVELEGQLRAPGVQLAADLERVAVQVRRVRDESDLRMMLDVEEVRTA